MTAEGAAIYSNQVSQSSHAAYVDDFIGRNYSYVEKAAVPEAVLAVHHKIAATRQQRRRHM